MKKIKLALNKEVVSILTGNEMNLVKGGQIYNYGIIGETAECNTGGGGGGPVTLAATACGTCNNDTCVGNLTCLNCQLNTYTCPNAPNPQGTIVDATCVGATCVGTTCVCPPPVM